jgi:hypothetical protein
MYTTLTYFITNLFLDEWNNTLPFPFFELKNWIFFVLSCFRNGLQCVRHCPLHKKLLLVFIYLKENEKEQMEFQLH